MADLFVSYAKPDWQAASRLVAFLETQGWSVWWDTGLQAGDRYRSQIATELNAARAVLVLWTPTSVGSDWVRAEAGAARNAGKLIPVRIAEIDYADIPLPFGELHTETVCNEDLVALAVATFLQSRAPPRGSVATGLSQVKYQVLTWLGILGGALTLFTNLSAFVKLTGWASWLVEHWRDIMHAAWGWLLPWFGLRIPREWASTLTFVVFFVSFVLGVVVLDWKRAAIPPKFRTALKITALYCGILTLLVGLAFAAVALRPTSTIANIAGAAVSAMIPITSAALVLIAPGQRLLRLVNFVLFYVFFFVVAVGSGPEYGNRILRTEPSPTATALLLATVMGLNILALSSCFAVRPVALLKRMSFIGIGLAGLFGLNLVSRVLL